MGPYPPAFTGNQIPSFLSCVSKELKLTITYSCAIFFLNSMLVVGNCRGHMWRLSSLPSDATALWISTFIENNVHSIWHEIAADDILAHDSWFCASELFTGIHKNLSTCFSVLSFLRSTLVKTNVFKRFQIIWLQLRCTHYHRFICRKQTTSQRKAEYGKQKQL